MSDNPTRDAWFKKRTENIHERVSAFDVLRGGGVDLKNHAEDRPEQFACPFHGKDTKPSARVYPADARSHSHAWCFVCQERWDAISLFQKFEGLDKFSAAIGQLEIKYGLEVPPIPDGLEDEAVLDGPSPKEVEVQDFDTLYAACERRLVSARRAFEMEPYLKLGSILDKVKHRVDGKGMSTNEGGIILRTVLGKIRERVRQCPDG